MIELTVPQPLATLAVEGVVTVLVVPEPPKCTACGGEGWHWRTEPVCGEPTNTQMDCFSCGGDGLARWPAEVAVRSSEDEPEGPLAQPYRTDEPEPPAFWEAFGCNADQVAGVELVDSPDGEWWQMIFPWGGMVVGTVTVAAAVPIVDSWPTQGDPFCVYAGEDYPAAAFIPGNDGVTAASLDIFDQLAFQDFPAGHTALILGGQDQ